MERRTKKPLSLPVLHIMLVLAGGARHGYAIKQEVEARTDGAIRLGPGTLYEAIQRLEDARLIEQAPMASVA
jgi:DNA-binding PadR family transcriptional regulator